MHQLQLKLIEHKLLGRNISFPKDIINIQKLNEYVWDAIYWRSFGVARAEQGDKADRLQIEEHHIVRAIRLEKEHITTCLETFTSGTIYGAISNMLDDICEEYGLKDL